MLNIQQKFPSVHVCTYICIYTHIHIHKIYVQNKKWETESLYVQDPELFLYEYVNILLPMWIHSCDINPQGKI